MPDDPNSENSESNAEANGETSGPQSPSSGTGPQLGEEAKPNPDQAERTAAQMNPPNGDPGWFRTKVSEANFAEWVMAFLTLVIAGTTIAYTVYACRQWQEMHSGGGDTHDLAIAAGKQADRMKDLADRMKDQADQTKAIADQAVVQAKAAGDATKTARDTLLMAYWPWVNADTAELTQPLVLPQRGARFNFERQHHPEEYRNVRCG